jgi:hypothetical protein
LETIKREGRKDRVNPARKYIRLQEIGLAFLCAWPVAMQIAEMYGLGGIIPQISVLMLMVAEIFFVIGYLGRKELKEKLDQ